MVLRFANLMFEPHWNSRYIDHVQITSAETLGMEGRGGYYEGAGALRDMVQNHLLQLLCLVAMEPPTDLGADSMRDEKVKVVRSLATLHGRRRSAASVIRAQYIAGASMANRRRLPRGKGPRGSAIEDRDLRGAAHPRGQLALGGRAFYMRVGKRLPKRHGNLRAFQVSAASPLHRDSEARQRNVLVIRIQPDEGISLRMHSKVPGPDSCSSR